MTPPRNVAELLEWARGPVVVMETTGVDWSRYSLRPGQLVPVDPRHVHIERVREVAAWEPVRMLLEESEP